MAGGSFKPSGADDDGSNESFNEELSGRRAVPSQDGGRCLNDAQPPSVNRQTHTSKPLRPATFMIDIEMFAFPYFAVWVVNVAPE